MQAYGQCSLAEPLPRSFLPFPTIPAKAGIQEGLGGYYSTGK
jgi:hypothetical protein